jgi:integron integrase
MRHPSELASEHINAFLTHLAVDRNLSASTQSQARAAIMFLYREVLGSPVHEADKEVVRAKSPKRLPSVLTRVEVRRVLRQMVGPTKLIAGMLYGSGLRLSEALHVRTKDLDLERRELVVRGGKGGRQRVAVVPAALVTDLEDQLVRRRALHDRDLANACGRVRLPGSYGSKAPNAAVEFAWQFLFPAANPKVDPSSGVAGRYHLHATSVQRAVKTAAEAVGLARRVSCHTFRHSFATHLLEDGYDIRTIQELLGHRSVKTTMVYTHVLNAGVAGVRSPMDVITGP